MIKELIKPTSQKIVIDIPKEYVNKEIEVLVFLSEGFQFGNNSNSELANEFQKITKKRVKPAVKYHLKMEDEINSGIF